MKQIEALTEILPYVREFQGKTFVIKFGGEVCQGESLENIAEQISLIHHIGIRLILVHGGGPQLDELLKKLSITPQKKAGRRITDDATLEAAKMAFAGKLSTDVVAMLQKKGARSIGLSGVDGDLIRAARRPPLRVQNPDGTTELVDFLNVGLVEEVNLAFINLLLKERIIPVISPLAADAEGKVYNVNADTLASKVAQTVKAEKMILLSNVPGILKDIQQPGSLVSYADIEELNRLIDAGVVSGGMLPKVQACVDALKNGVTRTHIIDGTRSGALLLELFLNEGVGTMLVEKL